MKRETNIGMLLMCALVSVLAVGCTNVHVSSDTTALKPAAKAVLASEVQWEQLNPARGDQSPKAGTLWGDRKGSGPTGFLLKPVDGFRSPPHIHNVSYRGVVISGLIHNDDPNADDMWMPAGSFWTQPKGAVHITAAKGDGTLAYIEIESGPYRVLSVEEAFPSEEVPVNLDPSNIVWIDPLGMPDSENSPKVAFLWGNPQDDQPSGYLVKLPTAFVGIIHTHGASFRAVVIQGTLRHKMPAETDAKILNQGSHLSSEGEWVHQISCEAGGRCIIYVRTDGSFNVISATNAQP